jgi:hypothetical protein
MQPPYHHFAYPSVHTWADRVMGTVCGGAVELQLDLLSDEVLPAVADDDAARDEAIWFVS